MLMQHLIRLVTPAEGVVLDPFMGSGTTAVAAEIEGHGWVGIEQKPEYAAIVRERLLLIERGLGLDLPAPTPSPKASRGRPWPKKREPGVMATAAIWQEEGGDGHSDRGDQGTHGGRAPAGD